MVLGIAVLAALRFDGAGGHSLGWFLALAAAALAAGLCLAGAAAALVIADRLARTRRRAGGPVAGHGPANGRALCGRNDDPPAWRSASPGRSALVSFSVLPNYIGRWDDPLVAADEPATAVRQDGRGRRRLPRTPAWQPTTPPPNDGCPAMNLDPTELAEHVNDADAFELPFGYRDCICRAIYGHQITKFMVLELVVAILMVLIFVPLARKLANGKPPKGRFWNMFEAMILFIRNDVVRPAVGQSRRRPLPAADPLLCSSSSCSAICWA